MKRFHFLLLSLAFTAMHADEATTTQATHSAESEGAQTQESEQKLIIKLAPQDEQKICDTLVSCCKDMNERERRSFMRSFSDRFVLPFDESIDGVKRGSLMPDQITELLQPKAENARSGMMPQQETTADGPVNRPTKHKQQTLYMVSTGPLRSLLPDPTSHRRHGLSLLANALPISAPIMYLQNILSNQSNYLSMLTIPLVYAALFWYHARDDEEEAINFLKHRWPVLRKELSFPENICTVMEYLRQKLLDGTLDRTEMLRCLDALQTGGQNEK